MKVVLELQPGKKVQLPLEIPDEELPTFTVAVLKARIMELNTSKAADELHVVHKSSILEDEKLLSEYNVQDGDTIKYLFAPVLKGQGGQ